MHTLRHALLLAGLIGTITPATAQYSSQLLNDPDLIIDWVDTNASFWWSAYDDVWGGFYTNVDREGKLIEAWGKNKNVLTQSRDAYAMVRAFQLTGNEDYLAYARGALDFMYQHGWDAVSGGWFNALGETGTPLSPNDSKTAFDHHYALLGPMAMVEATDSETDWDALLRGYDFNENALWDDDAVTFGYYDFTNPTGQRGTRKSFNATVDAVTTHALQLYLVTGEAKYLTRLHELADNMLNRLVASMSTQAIGFAEKYATDWTIRQNETLTIMGHVLKTAWCLARINQIAPDPTYLLAAEQLANHVLDNAYDHEFGGPYKDYDRVSGQMILWGIPDTTKAWWQMEQAIVAGLELYRTTGNPDYLEMADESLDFFRTYFQDSLYGEVYADRTRSGAPIPQWGYHKGNNGKAAYHSVEAGYYAYLYAKLFLQNQIATVHYRFDTATEDRTLTLNPLVAKPADVVILAVRHNGLPYTSFDPSTRALDLAAGTEGHFEVDFISSSAVANELDQPSGDFILSLGQNFPNPVRDRTTVSVTAPEGQPVRLDLFDVTGRLVQTAIDGALDRGTTYVAIDIDGLPGGVYVYVLSSPEGRVSKRMTVIR